MKSFWRIAVPIGCVALICVVAIVWHFVGARATTRKLAEDAKTCRVRAEQGDVDAQYELARLYYQGKGVPQDYATAVAWYRKAADRGNAKAQYGVGFMYEWGKGVAQDFTEAAVWCHKGADQGYAKAQYALSYMYYQGKGVPQDHNKANEWCRKAANEGYAKAQYALGYTYFEGREVPQDYTEAVRWYWKAAEQGYAEAQSDLGYMYSQGKGVPQDDTEAARWYRKAADQGYARAQDSLGYMYSHGKGVPGDYAEAARWYRKAAKQQDEYALRALDSMNIPLTAGRKIDLSVIFLFSIVLLIGSRGNIRNPQQRKISIAGLLSLLGLGLRVYRYSHIGILLSLSVFNAFYFSEGLVAGISVALLVSFLWPQGLKIALGICGVLVIGFNVYAAMHYDLRSFASLVRAFYPCNGFLTGMAIAIATVLWLQHHKIRETHDGNDWTEAGNVAGTEPLGM